MWNDFHKKRNQAGGGGTLLCQIQIISNLGISVSFNLRPTYLIPLRL